MKIVVCTCYSGNMQEVADLTVPSHKKLADFLGAVHVVETVPEEGAAWAKLDMVSQLLPSFEALLWLDTDLLVTNPAALQPCSQENLITAPWDINGFNSGVFWALNGILVRKFFHACRTHGRSVWGDRVAGDQIAMQHFSSHTPYRGLVHLVPLKSFCSYWKGAYEYPGCEADWWGDGDAALHLPGIPNERRVEIFKQLL
jgi:hypothetical protein